MDGLTIGLIVTGIASVVALIVNIGFASRAVGTVDEWQQLQQSIYGFVYGGLTMTVFLMCTAWLFAALLGPSLSWSMSLILSIFAFGTAFGAVAMASVPRA
jgi:hypothetical protein